MQIDSDSLNRNLFSPVAFPAVIQGTTKNAMDAWKEFRSLPPEVLAQFGYQESLGFDGIGFEHKEGTPGSTTDHKDTLHYSGRFAGELKRIARESGSAKAISFVNMTDALFHHLRGPLGKCAEDIQKKFSLPGFRQEVLDGESEWTLRYLYYYPRPAGEVFAAAHPDKCGFTLHLYESAPGLQCLHWRRGWEDMPRDTLIPGLQLQYRSRGLVIAPYHRVVVDPSAEAEGRYSMVFFVPLRRTPRTSKERVGRMQDLRVAFNYDIQWEEFQQIFKSPSE